MTDFLLVHGAWHGAWCWDRVARRLDDAGHATIAPCLPGMGERVHELRADIDLSSHVQDLVGVIRSHDRKLTAVAHSYAGVLLQMAYEQVGDHIGGCVFLDSAILEDGERMLDLATPEVAEQRIRDAKERGGVATMAVPAGSVFGLDDEADIAFVEARFTPHPLATYLEPVRLRRPPAALSPAVYITCTDPIFLALARSRERALAYGWGQLELAGGHDAMIDKPGLTADVLLQAAKLAAAHTPSRDQLG